jgi:hypothetical protein
MGLGRRGLGWDWGGEPGYAGYWPPGDQTPCRRFASFNGIENARIRKAVKSNNLRVTRKKCKRDCVRFLCHKSNTRNSVTSQWYPNTEKRVEKTRHNRLLRYPLFLVFDILLDNYATAEKGGVLSRLILIPSWCLKTERMWYQY